MRLVVREYDTSEWSIDGWSDPRSDWFGRLAVMAARGGRSRPAIQSCVGICGRTKTGDEATQDRHCKREIEIAYLDNVSKYHTKAL